MGTSIIVCVTIFCAVTSLVGLFFASFTRYDRQVGDRIAGLSSRSAPAAVKAPVAKSRQTPIAQLALRLLPSDIDGRQRLQTQLMNAGIYSPSALPLFLSVKLFLIITPPLAAAVAGWMSLINPHVGMLWGSLIGGFGLILPSLWLQSRKRQWHKIITKSLTDFLDLMVACLEVGLSPEAAFQRVTDELRLAHPRLSAELGVVQAQIELGASFDAALRNFADRSDCEAIRSVATVVQHGRRMGGGMAEVFRQQAEALRVRREHLAEEKAQQAAVKILIPTLLFIFPVIFVVLAGPAVIKLSTMFGREGSRSYR